MEFDCLDFLGGKLLLLEKNGRLLSLVLLAEEFSGLPDLGKLGLPPTFPLGSGCFQLGQTLAVFGFQLCVVLSGLLFEIFLILAELGLAADKLFLPGLKIDLAGNEFLGSPVEFLFTAGQLEFSFV